MSSRNRTTGFSPDSTYPITALIRHLKRMQHLLLVTTRQLLGLLASWNYPTRVFPISPLYVIVEIRER